MYSEGGRSLLVECVSPDKLSIDFGMTSISQGALTGRQPALSTAAKTYLQDKLPAKCPKSEDFFFGLAFFVPWIRIIWVSGMIMVIKRYQLFDRLQLTDLKLFETTIENQSS